MNRLNTGWIVLIVISSVIVIGGLFYFFYRLYINYIYKRKRSWDEITSRTKTKSEKNTISSLMPRQSMSPLIQEFLPNELKKQPIQRKMVTRLQFAEGPLLINNLKTEWDEMDTKSTFALIVHRLKNIF
jgi:hypothetical protein